MFLSRCYERTILKMTAIPRRFKSSMKKKIPPSFDKDFLLSVINHDHDYFVSSVVEMEPLDVECEETA